MSPLLPTRAARRLIMGFLGVAIPKTTHVSSGTVIASDKVRFGERALVNSGCFLDGAADLLIEDDVVIGMQVTIITGTHQIESNYKRVDLGKGTVPKSVRIGRGSWLGARSTILPGVSIGEGCVVAAGAVVNKDLAPHGLYAGVPAKLVKTLPTQNAISVDALAA